MTDTIEQVGAVDPTKQTSPIVETEPETEAETADERAICWFNGQQYGTGAIICSAGTRLYCNSSGNWQSAGSC